MMRLEKVKPLSDEYLESIGFVWHTDSDNSSYISDEIVVLVKMKQMLIMMLLMSFMICL